MAKNKNKGSLFYKVIITISATYLGSIGLFEGTSKIMTEHYKTQHRQNFKEFENIMLQNKEGLCITLPKQKNPITVALENFSSEDKQIIKNAIKDLDVLLPDIDYSILDNPATNEYVKLRIENSNNISKTAVAETTIRHNGVGQIVFPISMKIRIDDVTYWGKSGMYDYSDLLTHVTKHEMLHTLGFKDLYEPEVMGKSIMYYSIGEPGANYDKYTISDIENINKIYNSGIIEKEFPSIMICYFQDTNKFIEAKEDDLTPIN